MSGSLVLNHLGLILIVIGIIFMVAEMFVFSFGVLGISGFVAFMIGLVVLLDVDKYGYGVALPLIIFVGLAVGIFLFIMIRLGIKSHKRPIVTGAEGLLGQTGTIVVAQDGVMTVRLRGELWQVTAEQKLANGQQVEVVAVNDLVLKVKPVSSTK